MEREQESKAGIVQEMARSTANEDWDVGRRMNECEQRGAGEDIVRREGKASAELGCDQRE